MITISFRNKTRPSTVFLNSNCLQALRLYGNNEFDELISAIKSGNIIGINSSILNPSFTCPVCRIPFYSEENAKLIERNFSELTNLKEFIKYTRQHKSTVLIDTTKYLDDDSGKSQQFKTYAFPVTLPETTKSK